MILTPTLSSSHMSSLLLALSFQASFNHFAPVATSHCLQILLLQPPSSFLPSYLSTERVLREGLGFSLTKSELPTEHRLNSEWPNGQLLLLSAVGWLAGWRLAETFHLSFWQFKHPSVWAPPETLHKCTFSLSPLVCMLPLAVAPHICCLSSALHVSTFPAHDMFTHLSLSSVFPHNCTGPTRWHNAFLYIYFLLHNLSMSRTTPNWHPTFDLEVLVVGQACSGGL